MFLTCFFTFLGLLSVSFCASAQPFQGFYTGFAGHRTFREDQSTFSEQLTHHSNVTHHLSGVNKNSKINYWGMSLISGYNYRLKNACYGLEAEIATPNDNSKSTISSTMSVKPPSLLPSSYLPSPVTVPGKSPTPATAPVTPALESKKIRHTSTTFKRGWIGSLSPRIGIHLDDNHLVYIRVGLELSRNKLMHTLTHESSDPSTETKTIKRWQLTVVPAIGVEKVFSKTFTCRGEYSYTTGTKLAIENTSHDYKAHKFKLGIFHHF